MTEIFYMFIENIFWVTFVPHKLQKCFRTSDKFWRKDFQHTRAVKDKLLQQ